MTRSFENIKPEQVPLPPKQACKKVAETRSEFERYRDQQGKLWWEGQPRQRPRYPEVRDILIDHITIEMDRRALDQEAVADLAQSISRIGLQEPIKVRYHERYLDPDEGEIDGALTLLTGAHRIAACKSLGWETIPTVELTVTDRQARMIEIAENLYRNELDELSKREQAAEWMRLASEDQTGEADRGEGLSRPVGAKLIGRPEGGIRAAARDLDMPETEARRSIKIDALTPEAKAVAKETKLNDNRSALEIAAGKPKEEQVSTLKAISKAGTVAAYRREADDAGSITGEELVTTQAPVSLAAAAPKMTDLEKAWRAASQEEKEAFWFKRTIATETSSTWKLRASDSDEVRDLKLKLRDRGFALKRLRDEGEASRAHNASLMQENSSLRSQLRMLGDQQSEKHKGNL